MPFPIYKCERFSVVSTNDKLFYLAKTESELHFLDSNLNLLPKNNLIDIYNEALEKLNKPNVMIDKSNISVLSMHPYDEAKGLAKDAIYINGEVVGYLEVNEENPMCALDFDIKNLENLSLLFRDIYLQNDVESKIKNTYIKFTPSSNNTLVIELEDDEIIINSSNEFKDKNLPSENIAYFINEYLQNSESFSITSFNSNITL